MSGRARGQTAPAGVAIEAPASPSPARRCGAKNRRGVPCGNPRGFKTSHPGTGRCTFHGGSSPFGKTAAAKEAAENALAKLALPDERLDPIQSLLEAMRVASWREAGLRMMLQQRPALFGPDHLDDGREDVVSQMHDRALKRKAEIAKMAVDAGIDTRLVELAERQADVVIRALQAALDAAGVDPDVRAVAEAAAAEVLEGAVPAGAGLN